MIRAVIYFCLILALLGGYIMFNGAVLLVFACFLTLLAVVLVGTLLWQKRRCRMEAVQGNDVAELGETAAARFRLVNDGILPAAQMVIRYQVYECRTPSKKEKKKIRLQMKGRSEQYFDCRVPSDHSGVSVVRMKKIRLYDFLRIFSCHLPVPGRQEISVLPPLHQAELTVTPRSGREEMEEETDDTQKGDDPSVIYQIREYQPGDSMQRIHWKLSARTDQWMVKEFGRTKERTAVLLWLDLRSEKETAELLDRFREAAACLMDTFLKREIGCEIVWKYRGQVQRFTIVSEEDMYQALCALVRTGFERNLERANTARNSGKANAARKQDRTDTMQNSEWQPVIRQGWRMLRLSVDGKLWDMERCAAGFPGAGSGGEEWESVRIEL